MENKSKLPGINTSKQIIVKVAMFVCLTLFVSSVQAQTPPVCFNPIVNYTVGNSPRSMTKADFNGDGKMDMAVANENSFFISIMLGNGAGSFTISSLAINFASAHSITSADFNGDGKIDLAVVENSYNKVYVFLGNGNASFGAPVFYTVGASPQCIITSDFNSDGNADLAVANSGTNTISVLYGSSNSTFTNIVTYTVGNNPYSLTSNDFNGDGRPDLAVPNFASNNISILLGTLSGTFSSVVNYAAGSSPVSIITADFNGDAKVDIATANYNSNNISVLLGAGTGTFLPLVNYTVAAQPRAINVADFNSDGNIDVVTTIGFSNVIAVLRGSPTGSLSSATNFATGNYPMALITHDFNNDSRQDIAVANYGVGSIGILINAPLISVNSGSICSGNSFTLNPTGGVNYTFSTGSATFNPLATTAYTVIGTNTAGCMGKATGVVTVAPSPSLVLIPSSTLMCTGQSVSLTVTGGTNYVWSNASSASSIVVSPGTTTNYSVSAVNGLCQDSKTVSITVVTTPTVIVSSSSGSLCSGETATIYVSGASTYSWSNGATSSVIIVNPTSNSNYTVTGQNTPCTDTKTVSINVTTTPTISIASTASVVCPGGTATLSIIGSAANYTWHVGPTTTSIVVSPSVATIYTAAGFNSNCYGVATTTILISNSITVSAMLSQSTICTGETTTISASGAATYTWSNGATSPSIVVSPTATSTYSVYGENGTCNGSASNTLNVDACVGVKNNFLENTLLVYPNPVENAVSIETQGKVVLKIYNNIGLLINEVYLDQGNNAVNMEKFSAGIYYFRFIGNETFITKVLVKN